MRPSSLGRATDCEPSGRVFVGCHTSFSFFHLPHRLRFVHRPRVKMGVGGVKGVARPS